MDRVKTFTIARRRDTVAHEALVECWRDRHATNVMAHMRPDRYTLTFFDDRNGRAPYDGMAELGFDDPDHARRVTGANIPAAAAEDGWAELVRLPTTWLRVTEHTIVPGPNGRPASAEARAAAFKLTFLITARSGHDPDAVRRHWLEVHVPNFRERFVEHGGVRYVVNVAERSAGEPLLGLAELSYRDRASAEAHQPPDDGFTAMIDLRALPGRETVIAG